jgi:hypothetical protein
MPTKVSRLVQNSAASPSTSAPALPPRSWSLEPITAVAVMFGAHRIEQAKLLSRRDAMPIYISRGRFTSNAIKGIVCTEN